MKVVYMDELGQIFEKGLNGAYNCIQPTPNREFNEELKTFLASDYCQKLTASSDEFRMIIQDAVTGLIHDELPDQILKVNRKFNSVDQRFAFIAGVLNGLIEDVKTLKAVDHE